MSYLILVLVLFPLIAAGILAFLHSHSLLSPLLVLIGAIAGAITITFSGIAWLQSLHSEWLQSQAAGFIFLPVILPFYTYLGAVAGASLVAMLYGHNKNHGISGWFVVAAVGLTIISAGFIPAAIFATQTTDAGSSQISQNRSIVLAMLPILTAAMGVASAWLSSTLTLFIFSQFRHLR